MAYMRNHTPAQNKILDELDRALDHVHDKLANKIEREMRLQVSRWEKRFKRHKFRMAIMHGRLIVFTSPKIMGQDMPANIGYMWHRGAITELINEIEKFDDFLCDVDATTRQAGPDGLDTKAHP